MDVESGRLGESLSVSAYLSHADDDESLVKLHNGPLSPLPSNSFLFTKQVTLTFTSVGSVMADKPRTSLFKRSGGLGP